MNVVGEVMSYKLTIDRDLLNREPLSPYVRILKRWTTEGRVELVEAEPTNPPPAPVEPIPSYATRKRQQLKFGSRGPLRPTRNLAEAKMTFARMASILFPCRDPQRLNIVEVNDVAHAIKHLNSGNQFFVTGNTVNFISDGRREMLRAAFGVVALTPEETVRKLADTEGWK